MVTVREHFEQSFEHTLRVEKALTATGPMGNVELQVHTHVDFAGRGLFASVFIPSASQDVVTEIIRQLVLNPDVLLPLRGVTNIRLPRLTPDIDGATVQVKNNEGTHRFTFQAHSGSAVSSDDLVFGRSLYFYSESDISKDHWTHLTALARERDLTISLRGPDYATTHELVGASFQKLAARWPTWAPLRDTLQKAGLAPISARELPTSWVVFTKPSELLGQHFEVTAEVLVLCAPSNTIDESDISRVEDIFREKLRVDRGFALVIASDADAETRLAPVLPDDRRYLFLRADAFQNAADPQGLLHALLRDGLGRRRLFDFRLPAGEWQFFGREKELEALERDVLTGQSVGVFGLRKVGKTSLVRRLADKLRRDQAGARRVIPVEVDLQTTSFLRRDLDGVAENIGRALDRALIQAQIQVPGSPSHPLERLRAAVEHMEQTLQARLLLILDEYEVLLAGRIPVLDGIELLTWLRGLAQERPRSFSFVLVGRNQRLLAPARIEGADNPMYRFLRSVPLAGLLPDDCRRMVEKLGGCMGLRFEAAALGVFVDETGGHPALARTLGDFVDANVPTAERNPFTVDAGLVQRILPRFARAVDEDMRELVNAADDFDPRAHDYLAHLAHGALWIGGSPEARLEDALVGYGILHPETHAFRIGRLLAWLRENYGSPAKVAHG